MEGVFDISPSYRNFKNPAPSSSCSFIIISSLHTSQQFQMGVDNMLKMITEIDQTACGVMEEIGNAEILLLRGRKAWWKRRKGFRKLLMLYQACSIRIVSLQVLCCYLLCF
ncbi:hypothetical protein Peur_067890 [Populus x canadensis]